MLGAYGQGSLGKRLQPDAHPESLRDVFLHKGDGTVTWEIEFHRTQDPSQPRGGADDREQGWALQPWGWALPTTCLASTWAPAWLFPSQGPSSA